MSGKIDSGQLVTVSPVNGTLNVGDIVLCKVKGSYLLHQISAIRGPQYQISNAHGHVNGWVTGRSIFGVVTDIE